MNEMTATILNTLRTSGTVETFNAIFAHADANDNMIEAAIRGPECINPGSMDDMIAAGERVNSMLVAAAWTLQQEFAQAGVRVESNWGTAGDWAIFLAPHASYCRTTEFLITSNLTFPA